MSMNKRKRFGEILMEAGILTEEVLGRALTAQRGAGKRLGQVLEEMGIVSEKDIAAVLARQFGYKTVSGLARHSFPEAVLKLIEAETALKKLIFPLKLEDKVLYLAMVNPLDMETVDNLAFRNRLRIVPCVTTPTEIQEAVSRHYLTEPEGKKEEKPDGWTILVVDDQDLVRGAVVAALKRGGFHLLEASNGAEGVKAAFQKAPHLIFTDTLMPRMDGNEMFRTLQSNPATRTIPVIALSSKSAPEEEAKLLDMGYFDFIPKPINPVRLAARAKRALKFVYGDTPP